MGGECSTYGGEENACRDLVGKPGGGREIPLGKLKRRSESIKLGLKTGREGRDWMNLAYDRDKWQSLVNTAVNLRGP
jgi:hypothetical protein